MNLTKLVSVTLAGLFCTSARLTAEDVQVGTVRTLPVVSVSMAVSCLGDETKRVVYAPPPGWYVRSHQVVTARKRGGVTYSINTVPAGWNWLSDVRSRNASRSSAEVMLSSLKFWEGARATASSNATTSGRQANTSSHHVLVVDVSVKGEGLLGSGASVDMTVYAEMVYVGERTPSDPATATATAKRD